ncbi:response regulator [Mucilaginibacter ginsenosidivorax]|uniref:Response regulator n=1 Tax=Mucilaginibacter ginsenosidivorax TaxID=862126 RepID=A0A5B8W5I2_9SPHI|nr:response regulator [Mucilaginibacter ginsenosidivorax]QEC78697.1 response regulator [Mucilaginibacter ginsenosidivorax]
MAKQILIIEDDDDIRSILETALVLYDFDVQGVERTDDIIELIKIHGPDLVLTDYMMPGLNGGQICKMIKTNKDTSHIPVILMSAYHKSAIDLVNFNYDAYIPKPFDLKKLVLTINKLLN